MKKQLSDRFSSGLALSFALLWFLLVILAYLGYHPYYFTALFEMPNARMVLASVAGVGAGWAWWVHAGKPKVSRKVNGLMVYGFFVAFQLLALGLFNSKYEALNDAGGLLRFMGVNLLLHAALFLLYTLAYALGQPVIQALKVPFRAGSAVVLSVAVGASFVGLALFVLGALGVYTQIAAAVLALAVLGGRYQQVLAFWKAALWKKRAYKYNYRWLQLPVCFLVAALAVNGVGALKPFPTGFDGAVLYMNTTHLIADYQGLVQGGQAYNWQLVMSLGEVLFGDVLFAIGIAHFSFVLVLLAVFRLSRLLLGRSWSWGVVLLLALNPSLSFHFLYDEKIDLGFTFITLGSVLLLLEYWLWEPEKTQASRLPLGIPQEAAVYGLAGWLLGFAFGIKYTGLFGLIGAFSLLGYRFGGLRMATAVLLLLTGALFLSGATQFGYIPIGKGSTYLSGLLALLPGIGLLVLAQRKGAQLLAFGKAALLVGGLAGLAFLPWAARNLISNGHFSLQAMLESPFPTPGLEAELTAAGEEGPEQRLPFADRIAAIAQNRLARLDIQLSGEQREQLKAKLREAGIATPGAVDQAQVLDWLTNGILAEADAEKLARLSASGALDNLGQRGAAELDPPAEDNLLSAGELARREEIQRYIGYELGFPLYASLPYDVTMNSNIPKAQYVDVGFLFLLLFPILLLLARPKGLAQNATVALLALLVFGIGAWTVQLQETLAGMQSILLNNTEPAASGYINGMWQSLHQAVLSVMAPLSGALEWMGRWAFWGIFAGLLVLGGLLGWGLQRKWAPHPAALKYLLVFTLGFGWLWMLMGSGIPWYGFPVMVLLTVYLLYGTLHFTSVDEASKTARGLMLTAWAGFGAYALISFLFLFISSNQSYKNAGLIYQPPILSTFGEGLGPTETLSAFKPFLGEAIDYINRDTEDKVYRVGTFFNYHIDFNDRRVLEDNQLGKFDDLMRSAESEGAFLQRLKDNGFRYIIFDLNTASVDRTPEKTLTEKARRFTHMLLTSPQVRLVYTDNIVKGEAGEKVRFNKHTIAGKPGVRGETVYRGSFLLFEII